MNVIEQMITLVYHTDAASQPQTLNQWESQLSSNDALILLNWVEHPRLSEATDISIGRWINEYRDSACHYAGRVGKRLGEPRIRQRLEHLLTIPNCRYAALVGLEQMAPPESLQVLRNYISEDRFDVADLLAHVLAAIGTPDAISILQEQRDTLMNNTLLSRSIDEILRKLSPSAE